MLNQGKLAGLAQQIQPIKNMMQAVRSAGNPQAMFNQMMQNNPQYKQAMQIIQQNGNDPKAAFYALAQQKGIDPEQVISMLK